MKLLIAVLALLVSVQAKSIKLAVVNVSSVKTTQIKEAINKQLLAHYDATIKYSTIKNRTDEKLISSLLEDYKDGDSFFKDRDRILDNEDYYYIADALDKIYDSDIMINLDIDENDGEENIDIRLFFKDNNKIVTKQFFLINKDLDILINELLSIIQKTNNNQTWSKL